MEPGNTHLIVMMSMYPLTGLLRYPREACLRRGRGAGTSWNPFWQGSHSVPRGLIFVPRQLRRYQLAKVCFRGQTPVTAFSLV